MSRKQKRLFTPAVGFFRENGKTRPITRNKPGKLKIVRRVKAPAKGFPYSTPRRVRPMLANQGSEEDLDRPDYVAQRKFDGNRVIIIRDGDRVVLRSRSWESDFAGDYPGLVEAVRKIPERQFVVDGELTFFRKGTDRDEVLTALATKETKRGYDVRLMVFDLLYVGNEDVRRKPFRERHDLLEGLIPKRLKRVEIVGLVEKGQKRFYRDVVGKGGEGVMLKRLGSTYQEGTRNSDWLKVKKFDTDEAIVVGYTWGKGKRMGAFGSLILAKPDGKGGLRVCGEAGTGFKEQELREIKRRLRKLERKKSPVGEHVPDVEAWVKPEMVIEVKYHEISKNGKYRHPSFIRVRDDKIPKEVK